MYTEFHKNSSPIYHFWILQEESVHRVLLSTTVYKMQSLVLGILRHHKTRAPIENATIQLASMDAVTHTHSLVDGTFGSMIPGTQFFFSVEDLRIVNLTLDRQATNDDTQTYWVDALVEKSEDIGSESNKSIWESAPTYTDELACVFAFLFAFLFACYFYYFYCCYKNQQILLEGDGDEGDEGDDVNRCQQNRSDEVLITDETFLALITRGQVRWNKRVENNELLHFCSEEFKRSILQSSADTLVCCCT